MRGLGDGVGLAGWMGGMAGSGVALLLRSICNSASSLSSVVAECLLGYGRRC